MADGLGKNWLVYVSDDVDMPDYELIGCQKDASISFSAETVQATCKQSGSWSDSAINTRSWSVDFGGLVDFEHTVGYKFFRDHFISGAPFLVKIIPVESETVTPVVGDEEQGGLVIATAVDETFPESEYASYTTTLTGKGAPIITTLA